MSDEYVTLYEFWTKLADGTFARRIEDTKGNVLYPPNPFPVCHVGVLIPSCDSSDKVGQQREDGAEVEGRP